MPLAVRHRPGTGPTLVFLPGYGSDMLGTKAVALDEWAAHIGRAMLRFDYAGCGESGGRFADGTLEGWRDDALAVIATVDGPLVLVGSSMGGWIALLCALALGDRAVGLIGVAAAPDFTDWGHDPSLTPAFRESGQRNLLLGGEIAIDCPVRLLQGQNDPDVPWQTALTLAARLRSADVQVVLVKDGDHRLSREQDIRLLRDIAHRLPEFA